ncbi:MAG: DUF1266 domain-containing protein [Clostridiaceae bacterium]|nr:DUF1266 domain-containing protein [Clostridiaceae bacterium]
MVQKEKSKITDLQRSQLWMISLGMLNAYCGFSDDYPMILEKYKGIWKDLQTGNTLIPDIILHGVFEPVYRWQTNEKFNYASKFMKYYFKIFTADDFHANVKEYVDKSELLQTYTKKRSFLLALTTEERHNCISSADDSMYRFINHYETSLLPSGILAYEISTHVQMCRLAFYLKYISREELFSLLQPDVVLAKEHFSSFREYGLSCLVGLLFFWQFFSSRHSIHESRLIELFNWFLKSKTSPWTKLSWDMVILNE